MNFSKLNLVVYSFVYCLCFILNSILNGQIALGVESGFYENSNGVPIVSLIDQAKSTLDIEIYEMDDPKVIGAIRRAIKRGVSVRVVKEPMPVGSSCRLFEEKDRVLDTKSRQNGAGGASCEDQKRLAGEIRRAGGIYVPFSRSNLCRGDAGRNCLEHGKLVIADSRLALISSGNFNITNLCDLDYSPNVCNRDYSYISDDLEVVNVLGTVVEKDSRGEWYDVASLLEPKLAKKLTIGPNSLSPLISFIDSAKTQILVENQYLKEPKINSALIAAAKRGVGVQIIVESFCFFRRPRPSESKKISAIFSEFDKAGIQTKIFTRNILINGQPGYLHAKAIVVDHNIAWVGSVNGSTQAATSNREFGIFFQDSAEVGKLESILKSDFSNPGAVTWQESLSCIADSF